MKKSLIKGNQYKIYHIQSTNVLKVEYIGEEQWNNEILYIFRYTANGEEFVPHLFTDEFKLLE